MKYYLIDVDVVKSKDNKSYNKAYVLDYSNKIVSEIFIDDDVFDVFTDLLGETLFPDISDNIVMTYNKSKQCYILSYKR